MAPRNLLINYDRLVNASKAVVAKACVKVFSLLQEMPPEVQILAQGASFVLLCSAAGVPAQDAFTAVTNLMKDPIASEGLDPKFAAMRFHIREELLGR